MKTTGPPTLSGREQQILDLASHGLTDVAIAYKIGISEATVSTYWSRIRVKLGQFNRTELVAMSMREANAATLAALRAENDRLAKQLRLTVGEDARVQTTNFYKDLIEAAADAMLIVDSNGVIEIANESAESLFGYDRNELSGLPVTSLIPERFRQIHNSHREDYLSNPEKRRMGEHMATSAVTKSGKEIGIAATLSTVGTGDGAVVLCVVRSNSDGLYAGR